MTASRSIFLCGLVALATSCEASTRPDGPSAAGGGDAQGARGDAADAPCTIEGVPVSCALALMHAPGATGATPRERCEAVCEGYTVGSAFGTGGCGDGADCSMCVQVSYDAFCGDCGSLPDEPLGERFCDHDPCTRDRCEGDHCTHEPLPWIGEPCTVGNDFGTCDTARVCSAALCLPYGCDAGTPGTCGAQVPSWEAADGVDNDCDGATDEDPGPVLPLTLGGEATFAAGAGLEGGGFAVVWVASSDTASDVLRGRVTRLDDPLGGAAFDVAVVSEEVPAIPRVAPLPDGGFAVAWKSRSGPSDGHLRTFGGDGAPGGASVSYEGPEGERIQSHDLAPWGDGVAAVWSGWGLSADGGPGKVRLERFAKDGATLGSQIVADERGLVALVTLADGSLAVAWAATGSAADPAPLRLRRYDDGLPLGPAVTVLAPPQAPGQEPLAFAAAPVDDGVLLAWSYPSAGIRVVAADLDGTPRGPSVVVGEGARSLGGLAATEAGATVVWVVADPTFGKGNVLATHVSPAAVVTLTPTELSPGCTSCAAPGVALRPGAPPVALWVWMPPDAAAFAGGGVRARVLEPAGEAP